MIFLIKQVSERTKSVVSNLRGGKGDLCREDIFMPDDALGKFRLCATITIPDGCSIGEHSHGPDAEIYYILSGNLQVTDDGITKDLTPGDAVYTGGGKSHSVVNVSGKDATMLAIVML